MGSVGVSLEEAEKESLTVMLYQRLCGSRLDCSVVTIVLFVYSAQHFSDNGSLV